MAATIKYDENNKSIVVNDKDQFGNNFSYTFKYKLNGLGNTEKGFTITDFSGFYIPEIAELDNMNAQRVSKSIAENFNGANGIRATMTLLLENRIQDADGNMNDAVSLDNLKEVRTGIVKGLDSDDLDLQGLTNAISLIAMYDAVDNLGTDTSDYEKGGVNPVKNRNISEDSRSAFTNEHKRSDLALVTQILATAGVNTSAEISKRTAKSADAKEKAVFPTGVTPEAEFYPPVFEGARRLMTAVRPAPEPVPTAGDGTSALESKGDVEIVLNALNIESLAAFTERFTDTGITIEDDTAPTDQNYIDALDYINANATVVGTDLQSAVFTAIDDDFFDGDDTAELSDTKSMIMVIPSLNAFAGELQAGLQIVQNDSDESFYTGTIDSDLGPGSSGAIQNFVNSLNDPKPESLIDVHEQLNTVIANDKALSTRATELAAQTSGEDGNEAPTVLAEAVTRLQANETITSAAPAGDEAIQTMAVLALLNYDGDGQGIPFGHGLEGDALQKVVDSPTTQNAVAAYAEKYGLEGDVDFAAVASDIRGRINTDGDPLRNDVQRIMSSGFATQEFRRNMAIQETLGLMGQDPGATDGRLDYASVIKNATVEGFKGYVNPNPSGTNSRQAFKEEFGEDAPALIGFDQQFVPGPTEAEIVAQAAADREAANAEAAQLNKLQDIDAVLFSLGNIDLGQDGAALPQNTDNASDYFGKINGQHFTSIDDMHAYFISVLGAEGSESFDSLYAIYSDDTNQSPAAEQLRSFMDNNLGTQIAAKKTAVINANLQAREQEALLQQQAELDACDPDKVAAKYNGDADFSNVVLFEQTLSAEEINFTSSRDEYEYEVPRELSHLPRDINPDNGELTLGRDPGITFKDRNDDDREGQMYRAEDAGKSYAVRIMNNNEIILFARDPADGDIVELNITEYLAQNHGFIGQNGLSNLTIDPTDKSALIMQNIIDTIDANDDRLNTFDPKLGILMSIQEDGLNYSVWARTGEDGQIEARIVDDSFEQAHPELVAQLNRQTPPSLQDTAPNLRNMNTTAEVEAIIGDFKPEPAVYLCTSFGTAAAGAFNGESPGALPLPAPPPGQQTQ